MFNKRLKDYGHLFLLILVISCASFVGHQVNKEETMIKKEFKKIVVHEFGPPQNLIVEKVSSLPPLKPGEVLIKVIASGVSFTDSMVRKGIYAEIDSSLPVTPGYDIVGVIEDQHDSCQMYKPQQKVLALTITGGYSEYIILPEKSLVPVPENIDPFASLALVLPYVTAYQILTRLAKVESGQTLLLTGAGDVGKAFIDLAKIFSLKLYVVASHKNKPMIAASGAHFLDRHTDYLKTLKEKEPTGVDVILDSIGVSNIKRSLSLLKDGGTLVSFGFINKSQGEQMSKLAVMSQFISFKTLAFFTFAKNLHFYSIGDWHKDHFSWFYTDLNKLLVLLDQEKISASTYETIALEDVVKAHIDIERRTKGDKEY